LVDQRAGGTLGVCHWHSSEIHLKPHLKSRRSDVLTAAELTLVGRRMWNISGTYEGANPCYPFRMSKEPHDGQSSNELNSVVAHRGGGGIQPRNCAVPRRCRWMAHPSSKGKRGCNYCQSRRKRGPPMSRARTGAVGTVIAAFVPLSPVVAFLIVIAAVGRARRYCASGLARRSIGRRGGSRLVLGDAADPIPDPPPGRSFDRHWGRARNSGNFRKFTSNLV
jgi:hypothetical protein